ncbi:MAG: DUF5615 family PIN-like protein [Acidobacteriota bacterium]
MAEQVKFYFDEHVPRAVTRGLERRGVDVITAQASGRQSISDREQLGFAFLRGRVLVTMDSDYLALGAEGVSHAGIAYASHGRTIGDLIQALMLIYETITPADMVDHVEYL